MWHVSDNNDCNAILILCCYPICSWDDSFVSNSIWCGTWENITFYASRYRIIKFWFQMRIFINTHYKILNLGWLKSVNYQFGKNIKQSSARRGGREEREKRLQSVKKLECPTGSGLRITINIRWTSMLGSSNIKTLSHAALYPVNRCAGVYQAATNFATRNDHDFTRSGDKVLAYDMPTTFLPWFLSLYTFLHHRTLEDLLVSLATSDQRGAKILLDWNPYTTCTEDQLASIDRPSLFIRKRINKHCGGTVYGARSDDKIGPCKSAGYLTGRRTIFEEYLPSSLPSPLFSPCSQVTRSPARVLQLSPAPFVSLHRQFFITSCSPNNLSFRSFFFFTFQGTVGSVPTSSDSFLPKDNKARTRLTRYRSPNKYLLTLQ